MTFASTDSRMHQYQGIEVRAVACGGEHSLAATEAGELYTWGWGRYGNLGLGRAEDRLIPVKVGRRANAPPYPPLACAQCASRIACTARGPRAALSCVSTAQGVKVVSMSCGAEHSVGLSDTGVVYAWGWGSYGNLGDGERVDRWAPVKVRLCMCLQALAHDTADLAPRQHLSSSAPCPYFACACSPNYGRFQLVKSNATLRQAATHLPSAFHWLHATDPAFIPAVFELPHCCKNMWSVTVAILP